MQSLDTGVLQRIARLEETLLQELEQLKSQLHANSETSQFFSDALRAYREKHLKELTSAPDPFSVLWRKIRFYMSFGEGETRAWSDAVAYGFVCAGGGAWYSKTLNLLSAGDRIWVKVPGAGFVGVGRVLGPPEPASTFKVSTANGEMPVLDVARGGTYHREHLNDPECCEYFVPVNWLQTVPSVDAVSEIGLFGNQNTVCKPTTPKWRYTVERLKQRFPNFDQ